jgi:peptide/nickel transport system substrate-binding protein
LRFYQSESDLLAALKSGAIGAASGITPEDLSQLQGFNVRTAPLDRVFGVFFNQNQSAVLRDPAVRQALNDAIDKNELVKEVLGGYGVPLNGPVPPGILASMGLSDSVPPESTSTDPALAAQKELLADGWTLNANGILQKTTGSGKGATVETLSFTLTTGDVPELDAAAQFLRATWAHMGAQVTVQVYDQGDLTQNVIRPRQYDALLFGEVVNRELDLFAFWDSSQRVDPGLNIALYANSTADKALEQLRQTSDPTQRAALYTQFDAQIQKDLPAIFLYAPDFVYIVPNSIQGVDLGSIEEPSDRFLSITAWHTETDSVWPLFASHL